MLRSLALPLILLSATLLTVSSCDSGGRPDTGAGAHQTVPAPETCADLCGRLGDCVTILCNEDTASTRYSAIRDPLVAQCTAGCTDAQVQSSVSATSWSCIFQSSCRQVFQDDLCHGMGHYNCN